MKTRIFKDSNYKGIYFNNKTLRIALDPTKPITELEYPEFYDVKITDHCSGQCPYCYMDSKVTSEHPVDVVDKIMDFFNVMSDNEKPFQVAIGGGEPTEHPEFIDILQTFYEIGITPNYTTNGMFSDDSKLSKQIIEATKKYCGGVAVSCHPHLYDHWTKATQLFFMNDIKLNLHIIISDSHSADYFRSIYNEWKEKVDHFVLLPYGSQGRAKEREINWEYLCSIMPENTSQIAFGAGFHPYLLNKDTHNQFDVSLYEPESLSKFLDLETMKVYPSSFRLEEV